VEKLKVLFVASEAAPFIKSGGLGDVVGSLPKALRSLGVDVRVVLPMHKNLDQGKLVGLRHVDSLEVLMGTASHGFGVYAAGVDVPVYLIANQDFFSRDGLYGYDDDAKRYAFFTKAALALLPTIDFQPHIINFNDWQTGLGSLYLKDDFQKFTFYKDIKTVFTVHNLQHQGRFGDHILPSIGLNHGYMAADKLEFYGSVNYMKAGLTHADFITTVSPTYAKEIQTSEYGYGLEGVLSQRKDQLLGILNGIDYEEYNPATNDVISANFSVDSVVGKAENKAALQEALGLPVRGDVPLFVVVSRLAEQKGLDLIPAILGDFISNQDMQLAVLGNGEHRFEQMLAHAAHIHPDKIHANIKFDANLAHQYYAGADFFLMPSLFEPCGLSQLMAMRYGAIPVVRGTGGLVDTVPNFDAETGEGRGIVFENYDHGGIRWAMKKALEIYADQELFGKARQNAMSADFSWENSAREYLELYENLI